MDQEDINDLIAKNPSPEAEIQYQSRIRGGDGAYFEAENRRLRAELANRWIPVSERLPEAENHPDALGYSKCVLCYNPDLKACHKANIGGHLWVDIYNISSRVWKYGLWPTHWMPINFLPEAEAKPDGPF